LPAELYGARHLGQRISADAGAAPARFQRLAALEGRPAAVALRTYGDGRNGVDGAELLRVILSTTAAAAATAALPAGQVTVGTAAAMAADEDAAAGAKAEADRAFRHALDDWVVPLYALPPASIEAARAAARAALAKQRLQAGAGAGAGAAVVTAAPDAASSAAGVGAGAGAVADPPSGAIVVPMLELRTLLHEAVLACAPKCVDYLLRGGRSFKEYKALYSGGRKGVAAGAAVAGGYPLILPPGFTPASPAPIILTEANAEAISLVPAVTPVHLAVVACSSPIEMIEALARESNFFYRAPEAAALMRSALTLAEVPAAAGRSFGAQANKSAKELAVARPAGEPSLSKLLAALGSAGLQKVVDDLHKTRVQWKRCVAEALSEFDAAMDGIESVKSAVAELVEKVVDFRDEYEKDNPGGAEFSIGVRGATMFQTIIEGPSGCGKTTLARHLAKVFYAAGLVKGGGATSAKDPSDYFTEMQKGDAMTGFKDQAVVYLRDVVLAPNIGKRVVFIDEAPALCNGKDGKSADAESKAFVEELMKATQPAVESQRSLLILAGYGKRSSASDSSTTFEDVESANQGFVRRFPMSSSFRSCGQATLRASWSASSSGSTASSSRTSAAARSTALTGC
jgi:energy-coupling factor transporter ATP-binding protein EcfA2